jgi:hypothetical protein
MTISEAAAKADKAHSNSLKKLTPKARFKSLSRADQFIVAARTLADQLEAWKKRARFSERRMLFCHSFTLSQIAPRYIVIDPKTGLVTSQSIAKVKRALANAVKQSLGSEASFMFAIEQQDRAGERCAPHVHGLVNARFIPLDHKDFVARLAAVAGDDGPGTVSVKKISSLTKQPRERAWSDPSIRRFAQYATKNCHTVHYRSAPLMRDVPETYEALKRR